MATITLHPGTQPAYYEPTYSVQAKQGKLWLSHNMHMGIKNFREALTAARKRLDTEPHLFLRIVDQRGKVYWSNEDGIQPDADPG